MNKFKLPGIKIKSSGWWFLGIAILIISGIIFSFAAEQPDGNLHVTYFDVGQGDAIFIETPENHQILVDGGPNSKILTKLSESMPFYDKSLDLVVITHPHADHVNGLIDVLDRYQVSQILMTGIIYNSAGYTELKSIIKDKQISIKTAFSGQKISYGDGPIIKILEPEKSLQGERIQNLNNSSIVLKIEYQNKSELLMGDFEKDAQDKISANYLTNFKTDVLKAAHHGSYNGLSLRFLTAVKPEYIIVSVGANNRYGHPHKDFLDLVSKYSVYRTDQDGDIYTSIDTNGKLEISTQK